MNIRVLNPSDYLSYKEIRLELLKNEPSNFGSSFEDESQFSDQKWITRISNINSYSIGAFIDSKIVGICVLMLNPREKMKHGANIYSVYVKKEFRKRGIAEKLINKAIDIALDNNVEIIYLSVVKENVNALNLYKKMNFSIYGEEPKMIKYNGIYMNQYLMFKHINYNEE